VETLWC